MPRNCFQSLRYYLSQFKSWSELRLSYRKIFKRPGFLNFYTYSSLLDDNDLSLSELTIQGRPDRRVIGRKCAQWCIRLVALAQTYPGSVVQEQNKNQESRAGQHESSKPGSHEWIAKCALIQTIYAFAETLEAEMNYWKLHPDLKFMQYADDTILIFQGNRN